MKTEQGTRAGCLGLIGDLTYQHYIGLASMCFAMTTKEEKIEIIGKIINSENEQLIDKADDLLKGEVMDLRHNRVAM